MIFGWCWSCGFLELDVWRTVWDSCGAGLRNTGHQPPGHANRRPLLEEHDISEIGWVLWCGTGLLISIEFYRYSRYCTRKGASSWPEVSALFEEVLQIMCHRRGSSSHPWCCRALISYCRVASFIHPTVIAVWLKFSDSGTYRFCSLVHGQY
jgi:hypothetical protein